MKFYLLSLVLIYSQLCIGQYDYYVTINLKDCWSCRSDLKSIPPNSLCVFNSQVSEREADFLKKSFQINNLVISDSIWGTLNVDGGSSKVFDRNGNSLGKLSNFIYDLENEKSFKFNIVSTNVVFDSNALFLGSNKIKVHADKLIILSLYTYHLYFIDIKAQRSISLGLNSKEVWSKIFMSEKLHKIWKNEEENLDNLNQAGLPIVVPRNILIHDNKVFVSGHFSSPISKPQKGYRTEATLLSFDLDGNYLKADFFELKDKEYLSQNSPSDFWFEDDYLIWPNFNARNSPNAKSYFRCKMGGKRGEYLFNKFLDYPIQEYLSSVPERSGDFILLESAKAYSLSEDKVFKFTLPDSTYLGGLFKKDDFFIGVVLEKGASQKANLAYFNPEGELLKSFEIPPCKSDIFIDPNKMAYLGIDDCLKTIEFIFD